MIGAVDDRSRALIDIANEGKLPLLGTGLLQNRVLHVDYVNKELTLD